VKAHFVLAGFTIRKVCPAYHYDFVSLAMLTVMNNLVDAGLANDFSGAMTPTAGSSSSLVWILKIAGLRAEG
jgi:hypothetical protein